MKWRISSSNEGPWDALGLQTPKSPHGAAFVPKCLVSDFPIYAWLLELNYSGTLFFFYPFSHIPLFLPNWHFKKLGFAYLKALLSSRFWPSWNMLCLSKITISVPSKHSLELSFMASLCRPWRHQFPTGSTLTAVLTTSTAATLPWTLVHVLKWPNC